MKAEEFVKRLTHDGPAALYKSEWAKSPYIILIILGSIIFLVIYGLFWIIKWIVFSPIRPFTKSKWLCQQGFHKYREYKGHPNPKEWTDYYKCTICEKIKAVYIYPDYI